MWATYTVTLVALATLTAALEVTITPGVLKGQLKKTENDVEYVAFTSIPYARPPVGDLRFQPPQPIDRWQGVYDATGAPPMCPQLSKERFRQVEPVVGQEDCLYLNVFVPRSAMKSGKKLPIVFVIHGGGFVFGASNPDFLGPENFMDSEEVILVSINYRIGILGFLSLEDEVLPGNFGIRDLIAGLEWVKAHIEAFSGNPKAVTLLGMSAGARAVQYLMIAPQAEGLFSQGIIQSGSVVNDPSTYFGEGPAFYASSVIEAVECEAGIGSEEVLKCLQEKKFEDLVAQNGLYEKFFLVFNPWKPVIDANFSSSPLFSDEPINLLMSGRYQQVPIIVGFNTDEGALQAQEFVSDDEKYGDVEDAYDVMGPVLLLGADEQSVSDEDGSTANLYKLQYIGDTNGGAFSRDNVHLIVKMLSDARYIGPTNSFVEVMSQTSKKPIYYYNYNHRSARSMTDVLSPDNGMDPESRIDLGIAHGDEMFSLFNQKGFLASPQDKPMVKKMIKLWTEFAKTGIPDKDWTPITKDKVEFAVLDSEASRMAMPEDFMKRMEFFGSMTTLMNNYRSFDYLNHPAVRELLKAKEAEEDELESKHDEL